jgi:hypothetical protein
MEGVSAILSGKFTRRPDTEIMKNSFNSARTGTALAITAGIAYTVCAAAFWLWPEQGIDFLNTVFHGLDFRKLGQPVSFTLKLFVVPLLAFVVWGFLVGALFAWLQGVLHRSVKT